MSKNEILAKLQSGELPIEDAVKLLAKIDGDAMAVAMAQAKTGAAKAFSVKADSRKGIFTVQLPGMGMAIAPPAEALEALLLPANIAALTDALAKHGAERKATRAAYKLTDEYKASAQQMFSAASAAKSKAA